MRILALDTATQACSTALLTADATITRELLTERGHAEHILSMVDAVLTEAGIGLNEVSALAFGRGPGAFTGVRLAASVAQGLAFAAQLPVVPVSDLLAIAQRAFDADRELEHVLVCQDARMQEVYWGCFDRGTDGLASLVGAENVGRAGEVELPAAWRGAIGAAGQGFRVYPELKSVLEGGFGSIQEELFPRAVEIARLAWPCALAGLTVEANEALPVYVRDNVTRTSRI
jgi:tRNA threonylcarbamoyladenosine biosynthesis protein TsaB